MTVRGNRSPGPVLGIETATAKGSVALVRGGTLLGELLLHRPRSHSEGLLTSVDTLLEAASLRTDELGAVAVSIGPGSFTGLRIGVAAAKGLAFSLGLPLFGVPTLEIMAANASPGLKNVCVVIDARRGEVFSALFTTAKGRPLKTSGERIFTPEELADSLTPGTVVVGDPPPLLLSLLTGERAPPLLLAPASQNYPRASNVALAGEVMLASGQPSQTGSLVPLYLRPSDAETNIGRKSRCRKPS